MYIFIYYFASLINNKFKNCQRNLKALDYCIKIKKTVLDLFLTQKIYSICRWVFSKNSEILDP